MKSRLLIVLLLSAGSLAQDAIPAGTILPVQLNSSLCSRKAHAGQLVSARLMQDVPLSPRSRLPAGAKVIGHIVTAHPERNNEAELSVRFDTVAVGKRTIAVVTNLRTLASLMEVSEAQVPEGGADRGTSEYEWTTDQVGGEIAYQGGGNVFHGHQIVGHSVPNGVLGHVYAAPGTKCRSEVDGNDRLQALWVFSSDACGLCEFPNLILVHAGRTDPVGEITLRSTRGNVNVRAGSGVLLRVNGKMP